MMYTMGTSRKRWPRRIIVLAVAAVLLLVAATAAVRYAYYRNLAPASANRQSQTVTIEKGATADEIAALLERKGLIRSAWAFKLYVKSKDVRGDLQAGTYEMAPSLGTPEIVSQLTHGKIVTNLVTILPSQRLYQIRSRLIQDGFAEADVDAALDPKQYADHPALVDKPEQASLEGYLYPDSFQRTATTEAGAIVKASLDQMDKHLTPELRSAVATHGLSVYQAVTLASMVEKEVAKQSDRDQVAQVFLKRLSIGMELQSDVTTEYGVALDKALGQSTNRSRFNTYLNNGLPPTPISNVSISSLRSVAYPTHTEWLYFVAGDDGTTYFSLTLAEHEAKVRQYCTTLCDHQ